MVVVLLIAMALVVLTVLIHLTALAGVRDLLPHVPGARTRVATIILAAITAHLIEISCFALAIRELATAGTQGTLQGDVGHGLRDYFYFSAVTFSSLGYGDVTPTGHLRILAAIEALTGIVLITWSASFAFIVMQRYWGSGASEGD